MTRRASTKGENGRRLPGLDLKPGALRKARQEAGLTLAQIAGADMSRTAVYLIEHGKARPTLPTLRIIAERTGKPVEFFLAPGQRSGEIEGPPLDLTRLESLAAMERLEELSALAREVVATATRAQDQAWGRFYLGQAAVKQAYPEPALIELRAARETFEALGDRWMVVECMDWEAAALYLQEDPMALEVAEEALAACRALDPVPTTTEVRLLGRLAAIHVSHHDWDAGVRLYGEAVDASGALRDLSRVGKMYNDLSIAYQQLGDLPRASSYSRKAITVHELLHDQLSVARAENNFGLVLMKQRELDAAELHLERSLKICDDVHLEVGKSHVLLSLAELKLERGDAKGAEDAVQSAVELASRLGEQASLAQAHELQGSLAESRGDRKAADAEFAKAVMILEKAGLNERLAGCHTTYARILEARGDAGGALEQMKAAMAVSRPDLAGSSRERRARMA